MRPVLTPDLIARYAGFLCAAERSFAAVPLWRRLPTLGAKKRAGAVMRAALLRAPRVGPILEFGVFKGASLRRIAQARPGQICHGFDSFTGFPEDGRSDWQADMKAEPPLDMPANVRLHQGLFAETVPIVAASLDTAPALIHIDCDLFSSTRDVLTALEPHLHPGQIMVFDELMHYTEFAANEMLALFLFLEATKLDFDWIVRLGRPYPFTARGGEMLDGAGFADYRAKGFHQTQAIRLTDRRQHFGAPAPQAVIDRLTKQLHTAFPA